MEYWKSLGFEKLEPDIKYITGHYFNFISGTMDIMDMHEQFKSYYLIMDNAHIHNNVEVMTASIPPPLLTRTQSYRAILVYFQKQIEKSAASGRGNIEYKDWRRMQPDSL
ncbi:hypothetical protein MFLAVUS_008704 [Mucor flavus]|uniref:Transposase n=1 Tax=Mucor flavus TaxID=439312 RepID=A0ABP9Z7X0_9FUNG